jgi:parallel beta-helix repeat protein
VASLVFILILGLLASHGERLLGSEKSETAGPTFFVAVNGNDAWSGKLAEPNATATDGPFASLGRARDAIRELKQGEELRTAVSVQVRGGRYTLATGLMFEAQDSGTATAPVIYRAYQHEKPILTGGKSITGFVPYKEKILKADLGALDFRQGFRQLLFDGERQRLARYPNFDPQKPRSGGWAYAGGKPISMQTEVKGESKRTLSSKPEDMRAWQHPEEVELFVFARYDWWNNICRIESIDAAANRIILATDATYAIRPGDRYYFQNALEELDAPGEWYLDQRNWMLYFWPPAPLAGKEVTVPALRNLIELRPGTAFLTIRGFTLECAEGTAVVLNGTADCLIAGNIIHNVGDYNGNGVTVSGGARNGVMGNDIRAIGRHAISLDGGNRITLAAAGNYADNNHLHHFGVYNKQGAGIELSGVGNRASHNLIHDGPRMGILMNGNNLVIEFNHIRDVCLETQDMGAIYTIGRDWISSRGSAIRYNLIHDVRGYGRDEQGRWQSPHIAWGIYLDDNAGGVDITGNILVRCAQGALHLHNARDNRIINNILVENGRQQVEYNGWTKNSKAWATHLPTMIEGYAKVERSPAWAAVRNMETRPENAPLSNGLIMAGNEFVRNIIVYQESASDYLKCINVPLDRNVFDANLVWHAGVTVRIGKMATSWAAWQAMGHDRHSVIGDPLFLDPADGDYRLHPDSAAYKIGFEALPSTTVGPYFDKLRASWPLRQVQVSPEEGTERRERPSPPATDN